MVFGLFPCVFRTAIFRLFLCLLLVRLLPDRTICSASQLSVLGWLLTFRLWSLSTTTEQENSSYDRSTK